MCDKDICYKIYTEEFGEDDFAIELFELCYKYCNYYKVDDQIAGIVFLLPCEIIIKNVSYASKYVFAVTTAKKYRGKGYMSAFLKELNNDDAILFLKPVNDSLINFYNRNGYKCFKAIKGREAQKYVKPCKEFLNLASKFTEFNNSEYTAMYHYKEDLDLNGLNFAYTME